MTWLKVSDTEWLDPQHGGLGNAAYGAYTRLRGYCMAYLTDGKIPGEILALVVGPPGTPERDALLDALQDAGLLEGLSDGRYHLPRLLEDNPDAATVEAEKAARKSRATKAANARWGGDKGARDRRGG